LFPIGNIVIFRYTYFIIAKLCVNAKVEETGIYSLRGDSDSAILAADFTAWLSPQPKGKNLISHR
jgi:hypothetical protein